MDAYKDKESRHKDVAWYDAEPANLTDSTREVLEKYSKIPADHVLQHCLDIRERAWDIRPYPCIGQFRFLDLGLGQAREYPEVLSRVNNGERYLDIGCCFGQDIRRLVMDGAPNSGLNLYGVDLHPEFLELGYSLFQDRKTINAHFFPVDIFAPNEALDALEGTIDIINASAFLHIFEWERQVQILKRVVRLLKPQTGTLMLGRQMGNEHGKLVNAAAGEGKMFRHNEESWHKLWKEVEDKTQTKWNVDFYWSTVDDPTRHNTKDWHPEGARPMRFAVWRE